MADIIMKIDVSSKNIYFFTALGSETRINILEILKSGDKNIGELANSLGISSAIMTRHINMLEQAGLIKTINIRGKRGIQKLCTLSEDEFTLVLNKNIAILPSQSMKIPKTLSIPVGQYSSYEVAPTCGLASSEKLIGMCDDQRYFSIPERFNASILWFQSGFVEYEIPGYLFDNDSLDSLEISLELCSEYPNYNETWPSDIYFYLNEILLGVWTCPGDFGQSKGTYTPTWWNMGTQHGLLKKISITKRGTMLDGMNFSQVAIDDLKLALNKAAYFKICSPKNTVHPGGINILGRGFGNYNQDIEITIK
jgi:predicted transcriptional regulator